MHINLDFGGGVISSINLGFARSGRWTSSIAAIPPNGVAFDLEDWKTITANRLVLAAFVAAHDHDDTVTDLDLESQDDSASDALDYLVTYLRRQLFKHRIRKHGVSLVQGYEVLFEGNSDSDLKREIEAKLLVETHEKILFADWSLVFKELARDGSTFEPWLHGLMDRANYHGLWVEPGTF